MKTNDVKKKFIELKVKGLSLSKISVELGVSKPTLIKWSKDHSKEIGNLLYLQFESIITQYKLEQSSRIESMAMILRKALDELNSRSFVEVSIKDLMGIIDRTNEKLKKELAPLRYTLDETIDPRTQWQDEILVPKTLPFPY